MRAKQHARKPFFISWRWRVMIPLAAAVMLVAMVGAYVAAVHFSGGVRISQDNLLLEVVRGLTSRTDALYRRQVQEANRIAYTLGVPESVARDEVDVLQESLEALARAADLDSVILTDERGVEVLGVQRVSIPDVDDYAVNSGTVLSAEPLVAAALNGESGASGLLRTPEGMVLFVSVPLRADGRIVGGVLAGHELASVVGRLQESTVAQVAVYNAEGELLQTTFDLTDAVRGQLGGDAALMQQALGMDGRDVPVSSMTVAGTPYRAGYAPLTYGNNTLGVVAVLVPDNLPFATGISRQLTGLLAASIAGTAVVMGFVGVSLFAGRVERVQRTAEALAGGVQTARTNMQAADEAGAAGAALDAYADRVQREQSAVQQALQRQRRETNHLAAVLESLPDGVLVQDISGRTTFINDTARRLLASVHGGQQHILRALAGQPVAVQPLTPGVYALGDPQRVEMGDRMLSAQAAAIQSANGEQVGTVIVMRDITETVRQAQRREHLLQTVEEQVQAPLAELVQASVLTGAPLGDFAREITKRAVALQKLVVEMRELTSMDDIQQAQKRLRLDTLVWTAANEWRQIALAADLDFRVMIEHSGLHVLGDERRLRWAIGNVLDNAIKYTPPGGTVTLEVNGESNGQALLRVRDSGVGILPEELPQVTARFYRGNPTLRSGEIIRTPGMGQGLHTAQQIFDAHGGFLKVRSKPGVGTAVYFSLPVTSSESLDLPRLLEDFEGETVQLPKDFMPDLKL